MEQTFAKTLSANDVGATGGHMGGILVPKGDGDLLAFLPWLDPDLLNPSAWIDCVTPTDEILRLRFVYYNNRMHAPRGTRNEYRITWLTKFLRHAEAEAGDSFEISKTSDVGPYRIRVVSAHSDKSIEEDEGTMRIKLSASAWRRLH